ncbi:hypothetical protein Pmar_PMAR007287 [Perkinsus marinus ATCC 50983]|uniref:Uncharacterized protein n=1 Tax=Perkinsus marinus (strain ATCC 50983 / TXsc) TaxID=423536 RepID=C5K5Z6_PERM5|nr:hypothetical protein Pmar_PMAR007287 [Perkinsus marinus ATCC 50983]EER20026.1 hypothetical protein Pmar_PMAR007287 [Perkinsus marinus ATCC 50983]|eukprot:XP_002788230.1 hypothetical protein Pmar_PMAR007287 [Perkinsus marinus ATCC 50983]
MKNLEETFIGFCTLLPIFVPLWPEWDVTAKDAAIRSAFKKEIDERIAREISGEELVEVT